MTPPAKASGKVDASVEGSATAPKPAAKPEAAKLETKEEYVADDSPKMQIVPTVTAGLGFGSQGGRNSAPFAIDSQSEFGDYFQLQLNGGVLFDLFGFGGDNKKARFRIGPEIHLNGTVGNENTGGSKYFQGTIGPKVELDWNRAYGAGLWGVLKGPSYVNIWAGIGYGGGVGTAETFSLHDQSGLAWNLGASLNVFNVNVRSLQIGADAVFATTGIDGSTHNSFGNYFGFGLTFRPSSNVKRVSVDKEICTDVEGKINSLVAKNAEIRKENSKILEDLNSLKTVLGQGDQPLTTEKIQKLLFYREVRLSVQKSLPDVKEADVRKAMVKAVDAKTDAEADAILKKDIPGLTDEMLAAAKAEGNKKYGQGYDYWAQITGDPVPVELPQPLPVDDCKKMDQLYDELFEENAQLRERNRDIKGRFDTAVLLDALKDHLGKPVIEFVKRFHGFILDFVQPNFTTGDPKDAHIKRLREYVAKNKGKEASPNDPELIKIAKAFFALPEWELQNLKDIADKLNGKVDPGFTRSFTEKSDAKKFDQAPTLTGDDQKKFEYMKETTWLIEGHTDSRDSEANNQALSDRRAEAIKLLLEAFGTESSRVTSQGFGETRLAVPEKGNYQQIQTAQNKNRRVAIRLTGQIPSGPLNSIPDGKSVDVNSTKEAPPGSPDDKKPAPRPKGKTDTKANPPPPPPKKDEPKPNPTPPPPGKSNPIDFGN